MCPRSLKPISMLQRRFLVRDTMQVKWANNECVSSNFEEGTHWRWTEDPIKEIILPQINSTPWTTLPGI